MWVEHYLGNARAGGMALVALVAEHISSGYCLVGYGVTIVPSAGSLGKDHNATPLGQCRVLIIAPRSRVCETSELTMGCAHLVLGYSRIDFRFPQGSRNFLLSGVGFLFSVPFCYLALIWYLLCYLEWR